MKKLLLFAFATLGFGAGAQDLSIALDSPATGTTIGPGIAFDFSFTITNQGSVDITTADTIVIEPRINTGSGYSNLVTVNGNDTVVIRYRLTGTTLSANGGSTSQNVSFSGVSIQNAPAQFDFCAFVAAFGPNWGTGSETNSSNNTSCNTVNYDDGGTVGIAESAVFAELPTQVQDNSFFANGSYNLDVKNLNNGLATVQIFNITGQEIRSLAREVNSGKLGGSFELGNVSQGVYIVSIAVEGKTVSAKKIMVQ